MSSDEQINKIKDQIQKDVDINQVEEMVKKNITEFVHKDVTYRVVLPTFQQKQKAYELKVERYVELLQDPKYKLQNDLKEMYLKRGINIDELTDKINALEGKKGPLEVKLGQLLHEKAPETDLTPLREEIKSIKEEQYTLSMRKTDFLQYSIESQVLIQVYRYLTFASTQKKVGETWVSAWDTYEDFLGSNDENLITLVSFYVSLMVGPV